MGRKLLLTISIALALSLSACSTREDFVVLNKSGEVIEVRYKLKRCSPEMTSNDIDSHAPAKLGSKEFRKSDRVWSKLPKERYEYDGPTCTYTVSVAPDETLLVDYTYNYRGHNSESSELHFDLEALSIRGEKGEIRLEGRQAQTQFKLESDTYVITYL